MEIIIWLAFAVACAAIASSRGRNVAGWFFIGLVGGCIALIILLVIPDLAEEARRRKRQRSKHRQVEEKLQQERMKGEAFRAHTGRRLDIHDHALEIDTKSSAPSLQPPPPPGALAEQGVLSHNWHYLKPGGDSMGPYSLEEIKALVENNSITPETLVWNTSMGDWLAFKDSPLPEMIT